MFARHEDSIFLSNESLEYDHGWQHFNGKTSVKIVYSSAVGKDYAIESIFKGRQYQQPQQMVVLTNSYYYHSNIIL